MVGDDDKGHGGGGGGGGDAQGGCRSTCLSATPPTTTHEYISFKDGPHMLKNLDREQGNCQVSLYRHQLAIMKKGNQQVQALHTSTQPTIYEYIYTHTYAQWF